MQSNASDTDSNIQSLTCRAALKTELRHVAIQTTSVEDASDIEDMTQTSSADNQSESIPGKGLSHSAPCSRKSSRNSNSIPSTGTSPLAAALKVARAVDEPQEEQGEHPTTPIHTHRSHASSDILECVEKMRGPKKQEIFLAEGSVSQKA